MANHEKTGTQWKQEGAIIIYVLRAAIWTEECRKRRCMLLHFSCYFPYGDSTILPGGPKSKMWRWRASDTPRKGKKRVEVEVSSKGSLGHKSGFIANECSTKFCSVLGEAQIIAGLPLHTAVQKTYLSRLSDTLCSEAECN